MQPPPIFHPATAPWLTPNATYLPAITSLPTRSRSKSLPGNRPWSYETLCACMLPRFPHTLDTDLVCILPRCWYTHSCLRVSSCCVRSCVDTALLRCGFYKGDLDVSPPAKASEPRGFLKQTTPFYFGYEPPSRMMFSFFAARQRSAKAPRRSEVPSDSGPPKGKFSRGSSMQTRLYKMEREWSRSRSRAAPYSICPWTTSFVDECTDNLDF
ncbi:hypothetical protein OF83DRAFT_462150 [Amylostereum chailletii]|nr:hypothetical protein OF83DRAFT_462150 [Amylostereum chailletii]